MRNQTARNHIAYRHSKTGTDIELQTLDNSNLGNDLKLNSIMFQNDKQGISNHKQHKGNNGRRMGFILLISIMFSWRIVDCAFPFISSDKYADNKLEENQQSRLQVNIGPCIWVFSGKCPHPDIQFYLYTRKNTKDRQSIRVDETWKKSNLSDSFFNPNHPTKVIVHGYNSDMFLTPLIQMKEEYFDRGNYNLFFVDWSVLARGPCYPSAAHNTKYAGECIGQLINRIRDGGTENIHIIGFSLGAHVAGFAANHAKGFQIPRITGLDPALPLFITADKNNKLDASDAGFVDVIHSNALVQGQIERCGTVDFYMNGGILQPGCLSFGSNPFACSHHRSADYFTESIKSERGFWGWPCGSYYLYLLGRCPRSNELHLAGEDCRTTTNGMFLITTNQESPFASGQWRIQPSTKDPLYSRRDPFLEKIDEYGKLDSAFNYIDSYQKLQTASAIPTSLPGHNTHPSDVLSNQINQNEFDAFGGADANVAAATVATATAGGNSADDKSRFEFDDDLKLSSSTERWRQNDKFILVKNPSAATINRTTSPEQILYNQQSDSSDEFQFPKVTYR